MDECEWKTDHRNLIHSTRFAAHTGNLCCLKLKLVVDEKWAIVTKLTATARHRFVFWHKRFVYSSHYSNSKKTNNIYIGR